ncbi:hypothetical protein NIES4071_34240 [Calothrix sp. NIES-4071]|nr:hypothetical protein NIES4071_34240 [Calothrix sp. NIES-4071]BAZ57743.1 hypothetical protein NIES4105_34170 [Calothrix sp. NIES-4105]
MIVTVRDPNILSNLDPKVITNYLKARGWMRESHIPEKESVWVNSTNDQGYDEYDITLPLNPQTRSYALRMAEILDTLEKVEERSQLDILSDLITTIPNTSIQGIVTKLSQPNNITVIGFVVGKPELINIKLNQEDYQIATTAYNERLPITCTGDLIKDKNIFLLVNHHSFTLYVINTEHVAA